MAKQTSVTLQQRFIGCLIGGAMGDAMGFEVKAMTLEQIKRAFGKSGITKMTPSKITKNMRISDETQLTLFTLHGIMWGDFLGGKSGISNYTTYVFYAYQQWLYTQMSTIASVDYQWILDNERNNFPCEFLDIKELFKKRSPSKVLINTLMTSAEMNYGKIINRINDNKNADSIRTSAAGLYFYTDPERAFRMGADFGGITHSHPTGYLAAGCFSSIISFILAGETIEQAVLDTLKQVKNYDGFEECFKAMDDALGLLDEETKPMDAVALLGDGKTAESALAIGIYCACCHSINPENAILLAVNQDGNSDACGHICGSLVGAYKGINALPEKWNKQLQFSQLITKKAKELYKITPKKN